MSFFTKDPKRIQTTWGQIGGNKNFLAYIDANVQDKEVIEQAKELKSKLVYEPSFGGSGSFC
jgi:hypothetical protein